MKLKRFIKPALWAFYLIIVFEILFMISPFALYFYSAYGPTLNFLHQWQSTAWLTQFFLPHFSQTGVALFNSLHGLAWIFISAGIVVFFAGAIPIYRAKLGRKGAVTGGLYSIVRHPQYVGLAIIGVGTVLLWPRFIVLIAFVTMLFLYIVLARWEEEQCLAKFGESYREYQARTGMFLPRFMWTTTRRFLPESGSKRLAAMVAIFVAMISLTVLAAYGLRDYSLSKISAWYTRDAAVLSTAMLTEEEVRNAYRIAVSDSGVRQALGAPGPFKLIVHLVPEEWELPDLPLQLLGKHHGHYTPADFDRRYYKLLFTRPLSYRPDAAGVDIVKAAYGRKPVVVAKVDVSTKRVTGIETPPAHVGWGDIPTPMF